MRKTKAVDMILFIFYTKTNKVIQYIRIVITVLVVYVDK